MTLCLDFCKNTLVQSQMEELGTLAIFYLLGRIDFMPFCICICECDVGVYIHVYILTNSSALVLTEASGSYRKTSKTKIYNNSSIVCLGCHQYFSQIMPDFCFFHILNVFC